MTQRKSRPAITVDDRLPDIEYEPMKTVKEQQAEATVAAFERIEKLEATIAEYEESLREIAAMGDDGYPVSDCRNIARAALLEQEKGGE